MRWIPTLIVVLGFLSVVAYSVPTFGTYNCASVQYPIQNQVVLPQGGVYGLAARTTGVYEIKLYFNVTNTLVGTAYSPYFSVYTNQTYVVLDLQANTTTVVATSPAIATCNQTLASFADEATRVVNIARASNGTVYRNIYLDQAAANLIINRSLSIPPVYANSIAAGTTTVSFLAGTGEYVNPGATVQSLFETSNVNAVRAAREIGVFYNATAGQLAYVFASRNIACGNGLVEGSEQCDDSNTAAGDGCSASCQIENGYSCSQDAFNATSVCVRQGGVSTSGSASVAASSGTLSSSTSTTNTASVIVALPSSSPSNSVSTSSASGTTVAAVSSISVPSATRSTAASVSSTSASSATRSTTASAVTATGGAAISGSTTNSALASLTSQPGSGVSPSPSSAMSDNPYVLSSASSLSTWMKILF